MFQKLIQDPNQNIPSVILTSNLLLSSITGSAIGFLVGTATSIKKHRGLGFYYGAILGGIGGGIQSYFIYPDASLNLKMVSILTGILSGGLVANYFEK